MIIFIRFLKIIPALNEIKELRLILITLQNLLGPFAGLCSVQGTIVYCFATVGMFWFGGEVRSDRAAIYNDDDIPSSYQLMNFNDMASSWVTLFTLMIVNNWQIIA
jgi:hypothetical protein